MNSFLGAIFLSFFLPLSCSSLGEKDGERERERESCCYNSRAINRASKIKYTWERPQYICNHYAWYKYILKGQ